MFKVLNKFTIKEFCGGSYVFIEYVGPELDPEVMLGPDVLTEQCYMIPGKNELAFRLKIEKDIECIGDYVQINKITK